MSANVSSNRTPFTITLPFVMVPVLTTGALVAPGVPPPPPPQALRANTAATAAPTPYIYFFTCFMESSSSFSAVSSAASDEYGIPITAQGFSRSLPSGSPFPLPPSIAIRRG
jgi:hypothetical protein